MLQKIIDYGVDVNAINKTNTTALKIACWKGNADEMNVLLNARADPNNADSDGDTCIHDTVRGDCSKEMLKAVN